MIKSSNSLTDVFIEISRNQSRFTKEYLLFNKGRWLNESVQLFLKANERRISKITNGVLHLFLSDEGAIKFYHKSLQYKKKEYKFSLVHFFFVRKK